MADYSVLPNPCAAEKFEAHASDEDLEGIKKLLKLSRLPPKTYANQRDDGELGISLEWLAGAKKTWETDFDWRKVEARCNSFANFKIKIEDDRLQQPSTIHFMGMFSSKPDAIPLVLLHGWPGSFMEFLGVLEALQKKYTPQTLPYHIIVPSLPGYAYSSRPTLSRMLKCEDAAAVMHKLMVALGFGSGYAAQGGDVGSMIARIMAAEHAACKALHLNFVILQTQPPLDGVSDIELAGLQRAVQFMATGSAYGQAHGTKPATIGAVLSSNPLSLLAWVGEKFLAWSDAPLPLESILAHATLYWLTESFPNAIYTYRQFFGPDPDHIHSTPAYYVHKPLGYSWFPKELAPTPVKWVETTGNLVWSKIHDKGGHFAALEQPEVMLSDLEEFMTKAKGEFTGAATK